MVQVPRQCLTKIKQSESDYTGSMHGIDHRLKNSKQNSASALGISTRNAFSNQLARKLLNQVNTVGKTVRAPSMHLEAEGKVALLLKCGKDVSVTGDADIPPGLMLKSCKCRQIVRESRGKAQLPVAKFACVFVKLHHQEWTALTIAKGNRILKASDRGQKDFRGPGNEDFCIRQKTALPKMERECERLSGRNINEGFLSFLKLSGVKDDSVEQGGKIENLSHLGQMMVGGFEADGPNTNTESVWRASPLRKLALPIKQILARLHVTIERDQSLVHTRNDRLVKKSIFMVEEFMRLEACVLHQRPHLGTEHGPDDGLPVVWRTTLS